MSIEQNETRNEFLLSEAAAAVEERIRVTRPAGYELTMYLAWMRGGCRAASGLLRRSETVARAWGEGGDRKAGALVEVFAPCDDLAMVPRAGRAALLPGGRAAGRPRDLGRKTC